MKEFWECIKATLHAAFQSALVVTCGAILTASAAFKVAYSCGERGFSLLLVVVVAVAATYIFVVLVNKLVRRLAQVRRTWSRLIIYGGSSPTCTGNARVIRAAEPIRTEEVALLVTLLIAWLPTALYSYAFAYEKAFLEVFHVPISFIDLTIGQIFSHESALFAGLACIVGVGLRVRGPSAFRACVVTLFILSCIADFYKVYGLPGLSNVGRSLTYAIVGKESPWWEFSVWCGLRLVALDAICRVLSRAGSEFNAMQIRIHGALPKAIRAEMAEGSTPAYMLSALSPTLRAAVLVATTAASIYASTAVGLASGHRAGVGQYATFRVSDSLNVREKLIRRYGDKLIVLVADARAPMSYSFKVVAAANDHVEWRSSVPFDTFPSLAWDQPSHTTQRIYYPFSCTEYCSETYTTSEFFRNLATDSWAHWPRPDGGWRSK
ncbi:MAG: hypothetical protein JWM95_1927 [Gemmatimonadetes bacterium]|nr:hypothetical protein [Gemmatimonadota bacterium]